ncbi:MAG: hypothetical protein ACLP1X_11455 [Polyangiaceae bacterium]
MPAIARASSVSAALAATCALAALCVACKTKASTAQCDQMLDRYAALVVTEKYPDAATSQIDAERTREKSEARGDDAFKNCSSEVSQSELECAMRSANAEAFLKCLE